MADKTDNHAIATANPKSYSANFSVVVRAEVGERPQANTPSLGRKMRVKGGERGRTNSLLTFRASMMLTNHRWTDDTSEHTLTISAGLKEGR